MGDLFDRTGKPISHEQAEKLFSDWDYRKVVLSELSLSGSRYRVITIWTAFDVDVGSGGEPQIFETTVFKRLKKPATGTSNAIYFGENERIWIQDESFVQPTYSTEHEARVGHYQMVLLTTTKARSLGVLRARLDQ